jgi:hypothetical protein
MNGENLNNQWLSVIGRALAYLCIHSTDLKDRGMADQAKFLKGLGMSNSDIASLLGTTDNSIRGLLSYAEKSKRKKSSGPKQEE